MNILTISLWGIVMMSGASAMGQLHTITPANLSTLAADSISLDALLAMDKQQFKGKSVEDFLNNPKTRGYTAVSFRTDGNHRLEAIRFKYADDLYLHLKLLPHLALENPTGETWALEDLKEVLIEAIGVIYVMHEK